VRRIYIDIPSLPPSLPPSLQKITIYVLKIKFYVLFCTQLYNDSLYWVYSDNVVGKSGEIKFSGEALWGSSKKLV